jgi:hypothetical protein
MLGNLPVPGGFKQIQRIVEAQFSSTIGNPEIRKTLPFINGFLFARFGN